MELRLHRVERTQALRFVMILTLLTGTLLASNRVLPFGHRHSKLQTQNQSVAAPRSVFRYVIIREALLHNGRVAVVLIDSKQFSETNLRALFRLLSQRFPEPEELHVAVFTSLEQFPTPEEEDYERSAPTDELPYVKKIEKYPNATYTRSKNNEEFKYSLGEGQPQKRVTFRR
jgi:hypothetical protein